MAAALGGLIDEAFSAVLSYFASSDPSPGGGLQPGDEWYARIHARLLGADSVWVLATPTSVSHPWLYWEAGIGRAVCPRGVVVLRVGLTPEQIPSPLSAYESYDALSADEGGIGTLLGKVANQISMKLSKVLVDDCTARWIAAAGTHTPEQELGPESVTPEQVSRIEGLIGRLETLAQPAVPLPRPTRLGGFSSVSDVSRSRAERRAAATADLERRVERNIRENALFRGGSKPIFVKSATELRDIVLGAPTLAYTVQSFDYDGDLRIEASDGEVSVAFWLRGDWVDSFVSAPDDPPALAQIAEQITIRVQEDDA